MEGSPLKTQLDNVLAAQEHLRKHDLASVTPTKLSWLGLPGAASVKKGMRFSSHMPMEFHNVQGLPVGDAGTELSEGKTPWSCLLLGRIKEDFGVAIIETDKMLCAHVTLPNGTSHLLRGKFDAVGVDTDGRLVVLDWKHTIDLLGYYKNGPAFSKGSGHCYQIKLYALMLKKLLGLVYEPACILVPYWKHLTWPRKIESLDPKVMEIFNGLVFHGTAKPKETHWEMLLKDGVNFVTPNSLLVDIIRPDVTLAELLLCFKKLA